MAATSAEPVSFPLMYEWATKTVASTDEYAQLQINIWDEYFPVVPIFADEEAICIGLPAVLCRWLERYRICSHPEDFTVTEDGRRYVEMCFLWVASCAGNAFRDVTPEVRAWRSCGWGTDYLWPSARAIKEIVIPRTVHMTGRIFIDLRWGLPEEPENLTVQELNLVLRRGIKKGPWHFYTSIEYILDDTPPWRFPGPFQTRVSGKGACHTPISGRSMTESGF
jgi:hypothetical protein